MLLYLDLVASPELALFIVGFVALTDLDVLLVDGVALEAHDLDHDRLLHLGARHAPNQATARDVCAFCTGFAHDASPLAAAPARRSLRISLIRARSRRVLPSRLESSSCPVWFFMRYEKRSFSS